MYLFYEHHAATRTSGDIILRLITRHLKYPIFLLLIYPLRFPFLQRERGYETVVFFLFVLLWFYYSDFCYVCDKWNGVLYEKATEKRNKRARWFANRQWKQALMFSQ